MGSTVGDDVGFTFEGGKPYLRVDKSPDELSSIPDHASITFQPAGGKETTNTVTAINGINDNKSTNLEVEEPLDDSLVGRSGKLTVTLADAPPALVVPLTAIQDNAGTPSVQRRDDMSFCPVQLGEQANGYVVVTSSDPCLKEGMTVVIP